MLTAIIVDDEPLGREMLQALLAEYCSDIEVLAAADSAKSARKAIISCNPDLVFLDVEMPYEDGFDFLNSIHPAMRTFSVVFVTAHDHYSLLALKASATDYLLKPVDIDELVAAVEKVKNQRKNQHLQGAAEEQISNTLMNVSAVNSGKTLRLSLQTLNKVHFVSPENIIYCKTESSYTTFFFHGAEPVIISRPWGYFEEIFHPWSFIRIHRSYIVNPRFVELFERDPDPESNSFVVMSSGQRLEVPRRRKVQVLQDLQDFNSKTG